MAILLGVLLVIFHVQFAHSNLSGECNSYKREILNEGYNKCVYRDVKGAPYIGIGYYLIGYQASQDIQSVGADYDKIVNGSQCLNDAQIQQLFDKDMAESVQCASEWLGTAAWGNLTKDAQSAIADMAFDQHYIGCYPVLEMDFVDLRSALSQYPPSYDRAISILRGSTWYGQEKTRCLAAIECLKVT
jgi:hypothetical protein